MTRNRILWIVKDSFIEHDVEQNEWASKNESIINLLQGSTTDQSYLQYQVHYVSRRIPLKNSLRDHSTMILITSQFPRDKRNVPILLWWLHIQSFNCTYKWFDCWLLHNRWKLSRKWLGTGNWGLGYEWIMDGLFRVCFRYHRIGNDWNRE